MTATNIFRLCAIAALLCGSFANALQGKVYHVQKVDSDRELHASHIKEMANLVGKAFRGLYLRLLVVEVLLDKVESGEKHASFIRSSLVEIEEIHSRLIAGVYNKQDMVQLEENAKAVSETLKKISDDNIWNQKNNPKIDSTLNEIYEDWEFVEKVVSEVTTVLPKVVDH